MTLRETILTKDDLPRRPVEVPEWGTTVYVRMLSGHDRHRLETAYHGLSKEPMRLMALMVVLATVDAHGSRVFQPEDVEALLEKNADAIQRVFDAASDFNRTSVSAREEQEGNSEGVSGGASL